MRCYKVFLCEVISFFLFNLIIVLKELNINFFILGYWFFMLFDFSFYNLVYKYIFVRCCNGEWCIDIVSLRKGFYIYLIVF